MANEVTLDQVNNYLKSNGRSVSELNPGSSEIAIPADKAFHVIELLRTLNIPISGGDVLVESEDGTLRYAYQKWGPKYISLNWHSRQQGISESQQSAWESADLAKEKVANAIETAAQFDKQCFIIVVF